MTQFYYEHKLLRQMRELTALDRQLEHWGWFRRHEHRPRKSGWLFRAGEALTVRSLIKMTVHPQTAQSGGESEEGRRSAPLGRVRGEG